MSINNNNPEKIPLAQVVMESNINDAEEGWIPANRKKKKSNVVEVNIVKNIKKELITTKLNDDEKLSFKDDNIESIETNNQVSELKINESSKLDKNILFKNRVFKIPDNTEEWQTYQPKYKKKIIICLQI